MTVSSLIDRLRALTTAPTTGLTAEHRRFRRQARIEISHLTAPSQEGPDPRSTIAAQMLQHSHATADFSYLLPRFSRSRAGDRPAGQPQL